MISANIPNATRKAIYRRDDYTCAICGNPKYLQIHHYCHRSQGGNDTPHNLITLCADCHALAHGTILNPCYVGISQADMEQAIVEYLADCYGPDWWPYK